MLNVFKEQLCFIIQPELRMNSSSSLLSDSRPKGVICLNLRRAAALPKATTCRLLCVIAGFCHVELKACGGRCCCCLWGSQASGGVGPTLSERPDGPPNLTFQSLVLQTKGASPLRSFTLSGFLTSHRTDPPRSTRGEADCHL